VNRQARLSPDPILVRRRPHGVPATRRRVWAACLTALYAMSHAAQDATLGDAHLLSKPRTLTATRASERRDGSESGDWPGYGRTYGEQHYSPLAEITDGNVAKLGLAWAKDLPPEFSMGQPIEVAGTLYVTTGYSVVTAFDAASGRELWRYDPHAARAAGARLRFAWGSRGIAWWNGRLYVGTLDGRLIALDAKTGKPSWSVRTFDARDEDRYITGAPRVFDGKVIIGHGGADVGPVRGYVTAYDGRSGKQLWRFWVVPGNPAHGFESAAMAMAAKTWSGEWWRYGGGGTVWNAITYDAEMHTVLLGTGNGAPHNYRIRSAGKGDNLFLCSIVALDAATGAYKWHYQVNPAETWDYNAAMDMELADITIGGARRKVLLTAPKNGFFYVIDRTSGKLLSAEPFAKVTWATRIDVATGRPVEVPAARFPDNSTFTLWPGNEGAHNWAPMAFNVNTGLAYIPVVEFGSVTNDVGVDKAHWEWPKARRFYTGVNYLPVAPAADGGRGRNSLLAWNPSTQKAAWRVDAADTVPGGIMTSAGNLVFGGRADGTFNAYTADSGKKLWSFDAQTGVLAAPITYEAAGHQYVTVLSGIGGIVGLRSTIAMQRGFDYRSQSRRILTFTLGGSAVLLPAPAASATQADAWSDPEFRSSAAAEKSGALLFGLNCAGCHGIDALPTGQAPDLRRSPAILSMEPFALVVHGGALVDRGMPVFTEFDPRQLADIRQYLRAKAAGSRERIARRSE
jgi:quinohemoprotein ethanol dehydrogenase